LSIASFVKYVVVKCYKGASLSYHKFFYEKDKKKGRGAGKKTFTTEM
jgi:hypothetical protein